MALDSYYQKFTQAYGIPVVSSPNVPDDALRRACYVLRFLGADQARVREALYRNWGRVGVIARSEDVTDIPEHSHLEAEYWNNRARGLGAMKEVPISTAAEENILCYANDTWYPNQDIMVHELNHAIHLIGAADAIPGWEDKLASLYQRRKYENQRWRNTYAMSTKEELFAEAAQSYFNVNSFSKKADGRNGPIDTRAKLREYDLPLYSLVKEVFPCANTILDRCDTSRQAEYHQELQMDCVYTPENVTEADYILEADCMDTGEYCEFWASEGHCTDPQYEGFMVGECRRSCGECSAPTVPPTDPPTLAPCVDGQGECEYWAGQGYCQGRGYEEYMAKYCMDSCGVCPTGFRNEPQSEITKV